MRRPIFLLAALALTGCDRVIERSVDRAVERVSGKYAAEPGQEWTMQVLGSDGDRVYLVTGPDGRTAAARYKSGVSTLIGAAEAQSFISTNVEALAAAGPPPPQKVAISAPGVSIKVAGDDTEGDNSRGRVQIKIAGVSVDVDGAEGADGHGQVRIGGVDRNAALKFIDENDDLSPDVKKQMRDKLGL